MTVDRTRLARIILAGVNDIEEWRLGDAQAAQAKGFPREYPAPIIDDYGILFIDITLDAASREVVCHEVNGPNAVGSDALTGDSTLRAQNEARQAFRRLGEFGYLSSDGGLDRRVVTLHAHQHWPFFRTGGEFYPRVAEFADILSGLLPAARIGCHAASDRLGDDDVSVVMGDVPAVARDLIFDPVAKRFFYQDRPVIFIGNPNLLPELVRLRRITPEQRTPSNAGLRVFHAWRFSALVHDKGTQQALFTNTGIRPLRHFMANSRECAIAGLEESLRHGPVVLKTSNTSGGSGVEVFVAGESPQAIAAKVDKLLAECSAKYGEGCESDFFPLGGFEFVRSTGYWLDGAERLWDLRIAVQFEPGKVLAYPVSIRLTPEAFDAETFHRDRRQWISNVSGRPETLLKSGMDDAALDAIGMSPDLLDSAMRACVTWTQKAWDWTARSPDAVYEDHCETAAEPFYRWKELAP